ncbi:hypothetical protein HMPREF9413_5700 [Paenibacillus sp. HGF7]|nr:hypothetical protein HMPREF9413_5700 [Paenibacillus sp. HGF7]EPD80486.1 hypothetical protein HMPREF1207_05659 [Paenibacillus sp. HGH0039]
MGMGPGKEKIKEALEVIKILIETDKADLAVQEINELLANDLQ